MSIAFVIVTVLGAVMTAFSAASVFFRASWVVEPLAQYGVPRAWWPWLATAKAAGAAGLLVGLVVPVVGVAAAAGLVRYFAGAVATVVRARSLRARPVPAAVRDPGGSIAAARLIWPTPAGGMPVEDAEVLAERFEQQRPRLRAVAYRMLGATGEAEDAVQEAWIRLQRADASSVDNLDAWLTTVVARLCLNRLRSRRRRREDAMDVHVPDPVVVSEDAVRPDEEAVLADSVGLALLVVLDTLSPAERLAFVLHDMFGLPFDQIGAMVERSPAAARQLASWARRRVRGRAPEPDPDPVRQRAVVDAFFTAARDGNFDGLVAVLHPDVVLRSDGGSARPELTTIHRGARTVASQALTFGRLSPFARPVRVNGLAGVVVAHGRPLSVMAFTVTEARIVAIDVLADSDRLGALDLAGLED